MKSGWHRRGQAPSPDRRASSRRRSTSHGTSERPPRRRRLSKVRIRRLAKRQRSTTRSSLDRRRLGAGPRPPLLSATAVYFARDLGAVKNLHTGPIPPCLCCDGDDKQNLMVLGLPVRNGTGRAGPPCPDEHHSDRFPATFRSRTHGHHADAAMRRSTTRSSLDRDRGAFLSGGDAEIWSRG